jgi:hypothetical protein
MYPEVYESNLFNVRPLSVVGESVVRARTIRPVQCNTNGMIYAATRWLILKAPDMPNTQTSLHRRNQEHLSRSRAESRQRTRRDNLHLAKSLVLDRIGHIEETLTNLRSTWLL